jgi:hypothetical protein
MTHALRLVLLTLLVVAGCKKVEEPAPPATTTAPAAPKPEPGPTPASKAEAPKSAEGFHTPILAAIAKAGLKVGVLEQTAAQPYNAKACVRGDVELLDVLLCSFDGEAPAPAEKSAEQFLGGATTGVVRRRGSVLIAVADRKKSDLRGRQISTLLQAFTAPSP